MNILVRIGLAVLDAPVPVALMGCCCLRIHFNTFALIHTVFGAANRQIMKRTVDIGMLAVWSRAITRQEWQ